MFRAKKIKETKRYCVALKTARMQRRLSLEDLEYATRINKNHLQALEECRIGDIPAPTVYIKQYIRCYAKAVGIDPEHALAGFGFENKWNAEESLILPSPCIDKKSLFDFSRLVRAGVLLLIVAAFAGGLGWQLWSFVQPPSLALYNPPDGLMTSAHSVTISGKSEKQVTIHINGEPVQSNQEGIFQTDVPLQKGVNTVTIQATKKSGKQTSATRTIVRSRSAQALSQGPTTAKN